jgi:hypothetical protein
MKTIFVANNHSFVDVITNSSSELFVCNTDKTIDLVKDILKELLYKHDPKLNFDDCFGEIELSKFNFDTNLIPVEIYHNYLSFANEYDIPRYLKNKIKKHKLYHECLAEQSDLNEKLKKRDLTLKKEKVDSFVNPEQLRSEREEERQKELSKIWEKYAKEKIKAECDMFSQFLKQSYMLNKQAKKVIEKMYNESIVYTRFSEHSSPRIPKPEPGELDYYDIWSVFSQCLSYNITLIKNQITIASRGDNSIPYGIFEDIENLFNAKSYHLG